MNCIKCYQEIPDGSKFCPYCGAQQPDPGPVHAETETADAVKQPETEETHETDNYGQQTDNYGQQADNYGQQADSYGQQYQQSQPVYQSEPVYQSSYQQEPQINWIPYLVLSIISTVCCCLPFGIVAIVFAAKINSAMSAGDYEAAEKAAKTAKIWIIVAVVVGIFWNIIQLVALGGLMDLSYYYY